jgi:hypothetical protein
MHNWLHERHGITRIAPFGGSRRERLVTGQLTDVARGATSLPAISDSESYFSRLGVSLRTLVSRAEQEGHCSQAEASRLLLPHFCGCLGTTVGVILLLGIDLVGRVVNGIFGLVDFRSQFAKLVPLAVESALKCWALADLLQEKIDWRIYSFARPVSRRPSAS